MTEAAAPKGEMGSVPSIAFTRLLPGPIGKVWAHLTETEKLPAWFGPDSRIEPRQGGRVSLMGGHIRGVVTQWQPPIKLIYTWNVFGPDEAPDAVSAYPESYPTFELQEQGSQVLLTFRHFPILERFVSQNAMGWHTMLDILALTLAGAPVPERAVLSRRNAQIYGVDLDNLVR
jgi:uncharacterized protein YndB with AHSA1/START domain